MSRFRTLLITTVVCVAFTSVGIAAEPSQVISLWPATAPGEKGDIGPERDQPPREGQKPVRRVTDVTQPTLSVFRPAADKDTKTAVVICPGGGYSILAWDLEGTEIAEWFNSIGVTGIVLKYRVPARKDRPRHEAPLQDAQRAIGIVRERASELGIDPQRVGVLGFSAGGHLAATLSNNYQARAYETVDQADGLSCRPDFSLLIYPAYLVQNKSTELAPEIKVTDKTPPTFIAMTEDDGVRVECALYYYVALKNAKVPAEMHLYPTGGHGYGLRSSPALVTTWPHRAEEWLRSRGLLDRP